ncbi:uncharacterized protein RHOBADRAFT_52776 [Rhodotorula graminis WP1]|uniref:GST N-terminal domain-containing protein n=1 Tax=Rhodotorula graminis (strain WP1) TaxID=578459 RepID=A0A194S8L4_RHOGW|nr:uncharacterized protein RHOBADRAFT_52776 [Rhodotorula graminis WP1]KPV75746.1 hypothetical protein RHOBADRAFT_52776 [Rhodotorula graminis WP1]
MPSPLKFYNLVANKGCSSPFFSPPCARVHVALLAKHVPFELVEVTYSDLRSQHWRDKLGVHKATAPFVEREDATFLMDSFAIAKWLDEAYRDRPSLFLPEAPVPVDVGSVPYVAALERYKAFEKTCAAGLGPDFKLFAPILIRRFDPETAAYWSSDARLGDGVWDSVDAATEQDKAESVKAVQRFLTQLSNDHLLDGRLFISSATKPGMEDFFLFSHYRLLRAVSASLAAELFETPASGSCKAWLDRVHKLYPLEEARARDPST